MNREQDQEHEERVRRRAYEIWDRSGRPSGMADDHWALAREEVAIEENQNAIATKPSPASRGEEEALTDEPVEELLAIEQLGDVPGAMTDQGDRSPGPMTPAQAVEAMGDTLPDSAPKPRRKPAAGGTRRKGPA